MKENVDANKGRMDFANNSHFLGNTDAPMCPLTSSPTPPLIQLSWYFPSLYQRLRSKPL